jgi:pimeloyl-ACP methyl ester carboxylesterase
LNHIYLFSGLGADERVFQKLDFSNYEVTFVKWIEPIQNEPIEGYAKRISLQLKHPNPILIGLSFGGIMAVEVAKQIPTKKVILIASAKNKKEIPFYFRLLGRMRIDFIVPVSVLKKSNFISNWFFGIESKTEQLLLKQILFDTNPVFLKWAIAKIIRWKNKTSVENIIHIHGTADRLLPIRFVECDRKVIGGGHFMTLNKSDEMNSLIANSVECE